MNRAIEAYCKQDAELTIQLKFFFQTMIAALVYQAGFYPWREMKSPRK